MRTKTSSLRSTERWARLYFEWTRRPSLGRMIISCRGDSACFTVMLRDLD